MSVCESEKLLEKSAWCHDKWTVKPNRAQTESADSAACGNIFCDIMQHSPRPRHETLNPDLPRFLNRQKKRERIKYLYIIIQHGHSDFVELNSILNVNWNNLHERKGVNKIEWGW